MRTGCPGSTLLTRSSAYLEQLITLEFSIVKTGRHSDIRILGELFTLCSVYSESLSLRVLHTWSINTANLGDQSVYGNRRLKETRRLSQDHRTANLKKYDSILSN